jgi:hypothetical protein
MRYDRAQQARRTSSILHPGVRRTFRIRTGCCFVTPPFPALCFLLEIPARRSRKAVRADTPLSLLDAAFEFFQPVTSNCIDADEGAEAGLASRIVTSRVFVRTSLFASLCRLLAAGPFGGPRCGRRLDVTAIVVDACRRQVY